MSWKLNQDQYTEFIRIWQTSNTSCEALSRLNESADFPDRPTYYNRSLSMPYVQGVAQGLRKRGVTLKVLRIAPENAIAPPQPGSHLDFEKLRRAADQFELRHGLMTGDRYLTT